MQNQPFHRANAYLSKMQELVATGWSSAAIIAELGHYQGGKSRRQAHAIGSIMPDKRAAMKRRNIVRNRQAHKGV